MATVFKRPAARRDLVEHYVYLAENAGVDTADRFLTCAEQSFADLLGQPGMGAPLTSNRARLAGVRKWHVKEFDNFLIFYLAHSRGISVIECCTPLVTGGRCLESCDGRRRGFVGSRSDSCLHRSTQLNETSSRPRRRGDPAGLPDASSRLATATTSIVRHSSINNLKIS